MLSFCGNSGFRLWKDVIFELNIRPESRKAASVTSKIVDVDNGCVKIEVRTKERAGSKLLLWFSFQFVTRMTNPLRYLFAISMILAAQLAFGGSVAFGQQFRQPSVPGGSGFQTDQFNGLNNNSQIVNPNSLGPAPSQLPQSNQHQDFVPRKSEGGLGTIPVRPRGNNGRGSGPYRPDLLEGRTGEQERILEQIRSGNFESNGGIGIGQARGAQIIRQRYDNGKDQLVRHVAQDSDGNYFNHGPWRLYNRRGEQVASGQFADGAMDGTWERWHQSNSGGMFSTQPFSQFQGPFLSTATFTEGKLNGVWVITDRARRKIVEVSYQNGKREGSAIWWFPEAKKMRVINFKNGELDGPLFEWNAQQQLVRNEEYIRGHKVIRQTTSYRPQQKSAEAYYLDAKIELDGDDSWWDAEPADYEQSGERFQHGPSFAWYSNGQRKMVGQFREDTRVGDFLWWHENGQRALAGRYEDGVKVGGWTWWHDNGVKSIEGAYDSDKPVGQWTWWDEDGQVSNRDEYGDGDDSTGELIGPSEKIEPFEKIEPSNPFDEGDPEIYEETDEAPPEFGDSSPEIDDSSPEFDDSSSEFGDSSPEIDPSPYDTDEAPSGINIAPPADVEGMEEIRPDVVPDDSYPVNDVNL